MRSLTGRVCENAFVDIAIDVRINKTKQETLFIIDSLQ